MMNAQGALSGAVPKLNQLASETQTENIPPLPRVSIHVFCETSAVAASVEAASIDRRMEKVHFKVQMGGIAAALQSYRGAATPNLIVLESQSTRAQLNENLDRLAEMCDQGTRILIIGHINDVWLYRDLMRRGVSEYMMAPFDPVDFLRNLSEIFCNPTAKPIGRTFAFIGAKGGVGASTIAHNIAWSLASVYDNETVIADLDIAFGTAGLDLNQDPTQTIADAAFSLERVDPAFVDRLLAKCSERLSLLAAPAMLDRTIDCSEDTFDIILDAMRTNVPNIVVDVPHIWSGWSKRTLIGADQVVIVAEPDLASLRNAKNLIDLLKSHRPNDVPPHLVLNKIGMPKRPEIGIEHFIKATEIIPLCLIPFDPALFGTASNNGQMIAESQPGHRIAAIFDELALTLSGSKEAPKNAKTSLSPVVEKLKLWVKS